MMVLYLRTLLRSPLIVLLAALFVMPVSDLCGDELASLYEQKATWAETVVFVRSNFALWNKDLDDGDLSDAQLAKERTKAFQSLWKAIAADFPQQSSYLQRDLGRTATQQWFEGAELPGTLVEKALERLAPGAVRLHKRAAGLTTEKAPADDPRWLRLYEDATTLYYKIHGDRLLRTIAGRLNSMGAESAELQDQFEELCEAGVPTDDPRWAVLQKKADKANKTYRNRHRDMLARIGRVAAMLEELGPHAGELPGQFESLSKPNPNPADSRWPAFFTKLEARYARYVLPRERLDALDFEAVRRAIRDTAATFPGEYPRVDEFLKQLDRFQKRVPAMREGIAAGEEAAFEEVSQLLALKREALLSSPVLDFDKLLLVRRKAAGKLGLPQNWQGNCALPKENYDNEIAILSPVGPEGKLSTLYRPEGGSRFVGDVDLHFDAEKLLFSMPGSHDRWQIWEIGVDGKGLRQVTPGECPDVDNYDACYLPDDRIIFDSNRCFHGVPCVGGNSSVANLFRMNPDGSGIRQLCFDQDHDWCPTVLGNGRVLYSRWEYTDAPHYFTRLLFHMNPDGTGQMEYYGSNSPWPNSFFYARPIPGQPTQVVAVISGHHGVPRMGEMLLFDPAKGRQQAAGAVQRIPGYGQKVEPLIGDGIVNGSWPRFLHPYPLGDAEGNRGAGKYFLAACQPSPGSLWGIYLVDTFDNVTLIHEEPGYAMLEPVPLRKTARPPVVPDRIDPNSRTARIYLSDIYSGRGLEGVPRGTVKELRIYEQHYAYPKMGGHICIGIDGPWDVKRILGTVPVESDGSANFTVPANTPIAVQPLDEKGRAVQIMRSWFTAMPGEVLSCVGCHEQQNSTPPAEPTVAMLRAPSKIEPWYGPARGFSFRREVQPVLDKYCVGCHDGSQTDRPNFSVDGEVAAIGKKRHHFTPSYVALHPYVRRPGPESDYFMQKPLEFHAGTSELVQMLEKGHYNVKLDDEAWDRLVTWIDLNVPDHGSWHEFRDIAENYHDLRLEMRTRFANRPEDPEAIVDVQHDPVEFVRPEPLPERKPLDLKVAGWPFDAAEAQRRQAAVGLPVATSVPVGDATAIDLALVPPGEFVMGNAEGPPDEYPAARVKIERPFYLGTVEVTNAQYSAFDAAHDSAYISMTSKDQNVRGYPVNGDSQPVVRVTWQEAEAFCRWLSERTGKRFRLPTEAEWEWACRAGTATPFSYGTSETDLSPFANLADQTLAKLARRDSPKWHPRDGRFSDGGMVTVDVGGYQPNAWGLRDMHGNAAEWTRSVYRAYPYDAGDGREDPAAEDARAVRGGSWYDRPQRATSSFRLWYQPWQRVYCVGFRVVMEDRPRNDLR